MQTNYSREDLNGIQNIIAGWDGYQTVEGRLVLLKQALVSDDFETLWRIKGQICHEGRARTVVSDAIQRLSLHGKVDEYISAFAASLDVSKPEDAALKCKLESITSKYK